MKHAVHAGGYKIRLTFEGGSVRVADLEGHLDGEVFRPLRDIERFKAFFVHDDLDTVVWENGADMSPDFLYEISEQVAESPSVA